MKFFAWMMAAAGLAGCADAPAENPQPAPAVQETREPQATVGDRYVIDASAGRFQARIGTAGLLSAFGHDHTVALREFSGEARFKPGAEERGSLRMTIQAASLAETGKEFSDADRKKIDGDIHGKALEASKYPEIAFKSTKISVKKAGEREVQLEIRGDLTLHGVTKPVTVPAQVSMQGDTLTARGEFTIRHGDYKIQRLSAAGGTVKASDEIRMSFEIVARKK